jgi:SSS family solute:Na+ symporter
VLKVPGLTGPSIDLALFRVSIQTFDPWYDGVIGAAGVLTALVPGSMIMMTAATLLANNIYRPLHSGGVTDQSVTRLARWMVPVVALVAVFFTLRGGQTIVALLLMGYSFVTQLFPALVMSLRRHNPLSSAGVFAGIVVGIATIAATSLTHTTIASLFPDLPEALRDLNIGIVALVLNVVTLTVVSTINRRVPSARSA